VIVAVTARPIVGLVVAVPALLLGMVGPARADVPVVPDRDTAHGWAERELLKPEYQKDRPGLLDTVLGWLMDRLNDIPQPSGIPGGLGGGIVIGLLVLVVGYLLWRNGGVYRQARGRREDDQLFDGHERTAAEHRAASDAALAAGDHATAVLERFRALVRGLQERSLLELEPGRTADEAARVAGGWLPDLAVELSAAARTFDDVRYGDLPADAAAAIALRDLEQRVQKARPAAEPVAAAGPAVPR